MNKVVQRKEMNCKGHQTQFLVHLAALVYVTLNISAGLAQTQTSPNEKQTRPSDQRTINLKLPTLFVVGDSTANNNANGVRGCGDPFIS